MATYVLVHGAWHGGWCWKKLTPLLRSAGHEVFTPTLTGLGERAHLAGPEINLSIHVLDVLGVLEYEDLRSVVLVGHSYGGMVITGVADRAMERLSHLVYLDAHVPRDGQSAGDLMPPGRIGRLQEVARDRGEGWRLPPFLAGRYGVTADADVRWLSPKLTDHPLKTMLEPLRLENKAAAALPRTYIYCNRPAYGLFEPYAERARAEGWPYHELATGHDAMVTQPRELAEILLKLA